MVVLLVADLRADFKVSSRGSSIEESAFWALDERSRSANAIADLEAPLAGVSIGV